MRRRLAKLLASHWIALALVVLATAVAGSWVLWPAASGGPPVDWDVVLAMLALLAAIGGAVVIAQGWWQHWCHAIGTLGAVVLALLAAGVVFVAGAIDAVFFAEDHFADGLTIPEDLAVREPGDPGDEHVEDPRGAALVALAEERVERPSRTVSLALPSRALIDHAELPALQAYLASSPYWHVGVERGRPYAYRRFDTSRHEGLHDSLNGYYGSDTNRRSWRVVLGFGTAVFADRFTDAGAHRTSARTGSIELTGGPSSDSFPDPTTYLTLEGRPVVVEIYERGLDEDRSITRASLALVEDTLASFVRGERLAPPTRGRPSLDLWNGFQPGIYTLTAMVNPGEPGHAYVRAFEVTRRVELSASRLRPRTLQRVGSSPDAAELFRYDTELTIYEGNWGQHYAARFEVWFVPESGANERLLISDVSRAGCDESR